jgi:phenylacetate-CoA ligase
MIRALNVDPFTARIAVLRADNIKDPSDHVPPFWSYVLGGKRLILSSGHLSAHTLPHYLRELNTFRPDVLWVHPTMLEVLCRLLGQAGETLRVPGVFASSEVLRSQIWRLAQSSLGCSIVDCYGQAERVAYAYATSPGEYYFLPGYAYVELLPYSQDEDGSTYEVIGTSLWNLAMPLVRYRTGDLVRIDRPVREHELEEIAYGLRPFDNVIGRSKDVLLAPDGRSVIPGLSYIPRGVAHLLRLQIVQERADCIVLRALTTAEFSHADGETLLRNARQKIPVSAEVRLEIAERLQRTSGGKTPFVIHSPAVQSALRAAALDANEAEVTGHTS